MARRLLLFQYLKAGNLESMRKTRTKSTTALCIVMFLGGYGVKPLAQGAASCAGGSASRRITGIRAESKGRAPGSLFVVVGKTECRIADNALKAWLLSGGKEV